MIVDKYWIAKRNQTLCSRKLSRRLVNQTLCSRRLAYSSPVGVAVLAGYGLACVVGLVRWLTADSSPAMSISRPPPPHL